MNWKQLSFGLSGLMAVFVVASCNKEFSGRSSAGSGSSGMASTSATIAVAVDSSGTDSVYILQSCSPGYFRDSLAAADLPDSAGAYLSGNYSGYSLQQAFIIKDSAGNIGGYVAIIRYNGKPIAILFDGKGQFIRVLEQRQKDDLHDKGWHHGGRFHNRDGLGDDTIAIGSLPSPVLDYMRGNYPNDTLLKAYLNIDSSVLVISEDNGLYANLFSRAGDFVRRIALPKPSPLILSVASDALPASVNNYLSATYPNYVFEKAYSFSSGSVVQGYIVVLDANNTKYAVQFDGAGNFMGAITIW